MIESAVVAAASAAVWRPGFRPMSDRIGGAASTSPNILLIPGTSSVAHLRENVVGAGLQMPDDAIKELGGIAG